ncbi:hypothetical protein [Methylobacterium iners]|uniref:Uncharacterized protein n=1 Tax=Methylobacterium iners TaxID=418707 RepID=A0ABQ4RSR7_9HYPH|nr:hypothetical protein [Methylobacterium iners]GJD93400.1 hypothetical protein OCOJLMKI_0594 [Methylobacterium iners]
MKRQHQIKAGGPKAYWRAMCALTKRASGFTIRDIVELCKAEKPNTVKCYVRSCYRAGHLEEVGERPFPSSRRQPQKLYAVKDTAPEAAPFEKPDRVGLLGAAHQQMWTAMRGLQSFTSRELAATASTDDVMISSDTARIFCWKLEQAGYLQVLGKNGRWKVLRIRPGKNTGPDVPVITGAGDVIDRNARSMRRCAS